MVSTLITAFGSFACNLNRIEGRKRFFSPQANKFAFFIPSIVRVFESSLIWQDVWVVPDWFWVCKGRVTLKNSTQVVTELFTFTTVAHVGVSVSCFRMAALIVWSWLKISFCDHQRDDLHHAMFFSFSKRGVLEFHCGRSDTSNEIKMLISDRRFIKLPILFGEWWLWILWRRVIHHQRRGLFWDFSLCFGK